VARDLLITASEDWPNLNARIGETLGAAGVNIEGTFGSVRLGEVHVHVEEPLRARGRGLEVAEERPVLIRNIKVVD
jgi:hypothetical protein